MVFEHLRRWRWLALIVVIHLALSSLPASAKKKKNDEPAEGKGARIYGKLRGTDGKTPLQAVTVHAYHLDTGTVYSSEPTGRDGKYEIKSLPFGYFDLAVETDEGMFVAEEVVSVPPSGKALVNMTLVRYEDQSDAWRATHDPREVPGSGEPSAGLAGVDLRKRGVDYWKSRRGVLIIVGAGTAALLGLAVTSDDPASPRVP